MIEILDGGAQTTIQDSGRSGLRHFGVPQSGFADPLSAAMANRLVDRPVSAPLLEGALTGFTFQASSHMQFAVSGADCVVKLNDTESALHQTNSLTPGDIVKIGPAQKGLRSYVSFSGDLDTDIFMGSASTYLPGKFGGYKGRALKIGDRLHLQNCDLCPTEETPRALRLQFQTGWVLRYCAGPHASLLNQGIDALASEQFVAGRQSSRMGVHLQNTPLKLHPHKPLSSCATFPGTIQCPPDGHPFLLLADAQTTGGYPYIAQIITADLHLAGQIKPGDTVRLLPVSPEKAQEILLRKTALFQEWLGPEFQF